MSPEVSLTNKYRPYAFGDVISQNIPTMVLKSLIKDVDKAPKSLIFFGSWGSGKTTCGRIFARAINCKQGPVCKKCHKCNQSDFYTELDSSVIGNSETMKEMKSSFFYSSSKYRRVIVFDESHTITAKAQTDLLKVLEENSSLFFIFCTTERDKLLDTIRSRSLSIEFTLAPHLECVNYLKKVSKEEGIELSDDVVNLMARRSQGHIRDLLQELEFYRYVGEEGYFKAKQSLDLQFINYLKLAVSPDKNLRELLEQICSTPIYLLRDDFLHFRKKLADAIYLENKYLNYRPMLEFFFKNYQHVNTSRDFYIYLLSAAMTLQKQNITKGSTSSGRYSK